MEQQEYNRPLPTIISKSKAVTVPTVRVADIDSGHEFWINRADWVEGRYEVLDGTDVKLLGEKKAMDADEKLMATLERLAVAIGGNGGSDSGELEAVRAKVAALQAALDAVPEVITKAVVTEATKDPVAPAKKKVAKKKSSKRKPRKVEAKK